jgi:L-rhamnose mutarotase
MTDEAATAGRPVHREAWLMWLKPGNEELYKQRHDEIWPELVAQIHAQGIRNYSIYRNGLTLFAYLERDTPPAPDEGPDPVTARWWQMMEPLMECNPDASPRRGELEEMFYLE